jgi:hypothetical protein
VLTDQDPPQVLISKQSRLFHICTIQHHGDESDSAVFYYCKYAYKLYVNEILIRSVKMVVKYVHHWNVVV